MPLLLLLLLHLLLPLLLLLLLVTVVSVTATVYDLISRVCSIGGNAAGAVGAIGGFEATSPTTSDSGSKHNQRCCLTAMTAVDCLVAVVAVLLLLVYAGPSSGWPGFHAGNDSIDQHWMKTFSLLPCDASSMIHSIVASGASASPSTKGRRACLSSSSDSLQAMSPASFVKLPPGSIFLLRVPSANK